MFSIVWATLEIAGLQHPSLLSDAMLRILLSIRVSHFDFCVAGDLNDVRKPLGLKGLFSTSESSEGSFLLMTTTVVGHHQLRAALPRWWGSRCRQLLGAKEPFQAIGIRRRAAQFAGQSVALEEEFVLFFGFALVR